MSSPATAMALTNDPRRFPADWVLGVIGADGLLLSGRLAMAAEPGLTSSSPGMIHSWNKFSLATRCTPGSHSPGGPILKDLEPLAGLLAVGTEATLASRR